MLFWSFLTKTKQDQALPSHIDGKIYPTAFNFGYDFVLLVHQFLGHPVEYDQEANNSMSYEVGKFGHIQIKKAV